MLNCMQANRDTNNVATYIVVKLFDHPYLHWWLNFALNYIGLLPNFSDTKIKMIFLEADYVKRPLFGQESRSNTCISQTHPWLLVKNSHMALFDSYSSSMLTHHIPRGVFPAWVFIGSVRVGATTHLTACWASSSYALTLNILAWWFSKNSGLFSFALR